MKVDDLLRKYPQITDQVDKHELRVILAELTRVLEQNVEGEIVEFGCYAGTTSLFLQRLAAGRKQLHVYDSFEGLPEKGPQDQSPIGMQFKHGELAASKSEFMGNFKRANLPLPIIHKCWFNKLTSEDIPARIALAFLDGDYYESILTPLGLICDRLSRGATVIIDDYQNEALPGASKAVDEWLRSNPVDLRVQSSLAVLRIR